MNINKIVNETIAKHEADQEYYTAKRVWKQMQFLSTQREMTNKELNTLRNNFAIVAAYEKANPQG